MHSEPNSFRRELARLQVHGDHPEADLLNAFAEGALAARERQAVMEHLAACGECRRIVSLAADAAPREPVSTKVVAMDRRAHSSFRRWMPIAAIAAGIAIAAAVTIRFAQRPAAPVTLAVSKQPEAAGIRPPVASTTAAVASAARPSQSGPIKKREGPQPEASNAPEQRSEATTVQLPAPGDTGKEAPVPSAMAGSPALTSSLTPARETGTLARAGNQASAKSAMNNARLQAAPQAPDFADAMSSQAVTSASAGVARPLWRISDQGQVQRSFGGEAWKTVLAGSAPRMHVLSMAGGEVWAGGEESHVYRSADNGNTWMPVALPGKNGTDHVIVHIRFATPQEIRIESADGTTWTSRDGGANWN